MNKQRRTEIDRAKTLVIQAREILENCRDEEQEYYDNMPENMQGSDKGQQAEQAASELSDAIDNRESAESSRDTAMGE